MSFLLNRKELVACAAMSLTKYKTLRERGQLPFVDDVLASEEQEAKQDRRQRRFTALHAMRLRAHDELVASGTLSAADAGLLIQNVFDEAVRLQLEPRRQSIWFGAVYSSADHGGNLTHVAGTLSDIEGTLAERAERWSDSAGFSQTRIIVLSLREIFESVRRTAIDLVHDFPATLEEAIAASRD